MEKNRHGLCIFVENEFGVIQRVMNLFSARGMNIETIQTQPIDAIANVSQISISLLETNENIELIMNLLKRLIIVHEVFHFVIVENDEYLVEVFKGEKVEEIKKILTNFDLKVFNIYSNPRIHCLMGKKTVIKNVIEKFPPIEIIKNYTVF